MTMMRTDEQLEYHNKIIKPLIESIEKAGGTEVVARKAGMSQARLRTILHKNHTMNVATLMQLCSALNITLCFIDMKVASDALEKTFEVALENLKKRRPLEDEQ